MFRCAVYGRRRSRVQRIDKRFASPASLLPCILTQALSVSDAPIAISAEPQEEDVEAAPVRPDGYRPLAIDEASLSPYSTTAERSSCQSALHAHRTPKSTPTPTNRSFPFSSSSPCCSCLSGD